MHIPIDIRDQIAPVQRQLLANLVKELLPLARIQDIRHLKRVLVVPGDTMEATVNAITGNGGYTAGPNRAAAIAVPVQRDGELDCHVVVAGESVRQLAPNQLRPHLLVSLLLEELLHVRVYATRWAQHGFLESSGPASKEQDVAVLCMRFHDEYIVDREKATISSSQPIYDYPGVPGERTPLIFWYGGQVVRQLDNAANDLELLKQRAPTSTMPCEELWNWLGQICYRGVFEPLARDAAFRAGNPEGEHGAPPGPAGSDFYRERVTPYWIRGETSLELSYRTELQAMNEALGELTSVVWNFIASLEIPGIFAMIERKPSRRLFP